MAFIIKDRVKEGTTSTGTGAITLGGAAATFDPFNSYMSNGDTTYYAIVHTSTGVDEWEVGIGTWNTGNTLTRTTVLAGSNGTSAENFSAGSKDVFMTYPASKAVFMDSAGDVAFSGDIDVAGSAEIETHIDLKTTTSNKPSHSEGRIFYDAAFGALAVYNDESDITLQVGQEEYIRVKNVTGATIANGTPVYLTGEDQSTPTIAVARADGTYAQSQAVGIATHDIENNTTGYITVRGLIADVDTSHLTVGEKVHVAIGASGGTQTASPTYPNYPTEVGICLISAASGGCIYVYTQTEALESLRVTGNSHFDANVTISGDLTVLGTQTIANSENIALSGAFNYFNSGDTIGDANTSFTGTGLDDATLTGHYEGTTTSKTFKVKITTAGTPDKFRWSTDNFTTQSAEIDIDGTDQELEDGISVEFNATTGHTVGDIWSGSASPVNVDSGIASNRNTGGSGVGYTHMGLYYDVSTNKWTFFDAYDPEPEGTIDTTDSSFSYATVKAGTFEGDLTGNVTGSVTGNVSGNVTGSLTGNVTGDVTGDVTGNADTATALETARTISLTGDVTGSVSFDGSANASITAVVQDDSHNHVISNVDGLQTALDAKADDTTTITAGNGLTGGGNLTANRTLNVGAGSGISVTADAVAHADTSTQASVNNSGNTFIQDVTLDGFGHVTGLTSGSVSIGDATITISAGGGLQTGGDFTTNQSTNETITLAHADTSSQASVNNSNGTVIQDITLDTYGHITSVGSINLDSRYYTETEADSRFLRSNADDSFSGNLTSADNGWIKFYAAEETDSNDGKIGSGVFASGLNIVGAQTTAGTGRQVRIWGTLLDSSSQKYFHDGYHPNADKWTTARTLSLSGDASGSVSWDGSANATLSVTVANDSHTHDGRYYTETEADSRFVNATGDTMTGALTVGTDSSRVAINIRSNSWSEIKFWNDGTEQFRLGSSDGTSSYGGMTVGSFYIYDVSTNKMMLELPNDGGQLLRQDGSITVFDDNYHPNADKWTTARTLSLSGDASGSVSWDGSANATLSVTANNVAKTVFNDGWGGTPDQAYVKMAFPFITGSGASRYYTYDIYVYEDIGNMNSHIHYRMYLHQRANGSTTNSWDVEIYKMHSEGKDVEFYYKKNASSTHDIYINFAEDYSGIRVVEGFFKSSAPTITRTNATVPTNDGQITPRLLWSSSNDGSGSGLDADLLDGFDSAESGASKILRTASNGYLNLYNWINVGTAGIYSSTTNSAHFRPNTTSTYGAWRLSGSRGSWSGIHFDYASVKPHVMFDSSGNGGFYHESGGRWPFYYHYTNNCVAIGGSTTSSGYKLRMNGAVHGGNNDFNYINQIHFNDNVRFYDDGNDNYLNYKWGDTGAGGIKFYDGNTTLHGYIYGDGSGRFGLLDNDGNWAVHIGVGSEPLQLRCNNNAELYVYDSYVHAPGSFRSPNMYVDSAIYHNGDTNTYMQFHAADQWRVVTGGGERLEVNNSFVTATKPVRVNSSQPFYENSQVISGNYTISNNFNAMSAGPITINSGVTVTIGDGEAWAIV